MEGAGEMITEKTIREAYLFLRKNNNTIPDETLNFIKYASLRQLTAIEIDTHIGYSKTIELCQCPNCKIFGVPIYDDVNFCFSCGQKIVLDINN